MKKNTADRIVDALSGLAAISIGVAFLVRALDKPKLKLVERPDPPDPEPEHVEEQTRPVAPYTDENCEICGPQECRVESYRCSLHEVEH